jgi:PAS domain S-box-containing protein
MDCAETKAILRRSITALVLVSCAYALQGAPKPKTIRVVMDNDYAPFSFRSDEGKLQGISVDQWQAWERKTGVKVEIHAMDWDQALHHMRAGDFDVIESIIATRERRKEFDFSPPYAEVGACIFFRRDISAITDLKSLEGFPVGVKAGDLHADQVRESGITTVIAFNSFNDIIKAARQRQINVFVADKPAALYLLNKYGMESNFRHSAPVSNDELRRAVRKGDVTTLRLVSDGFAAIDRRELKRIDDKWFGHTINTYRRYLGYAAFAVALALLLILVLSVWNRALSRKVLQRTAALRESEQRFRQIAENIREVFWLIDFDSGRFLYMSPAYEAVWERSRESLYDDPQSFVAAIHPEDRQRVTAAMQSDGERGTDLEYRLVQPDGSSRWIRHRGFPISDGTGRIYRLAGIAEDITERKSAVDALKAAEDRIGLIIDTIPTMVWRLGPDGRLDFVNQRWIDYTGASLEQAIREPVAVVHPDDRPRVLETWLQDMNAGEPSEDEMRLRRADGEYRWFLVRTVPLRGERGEIVSWYGSNTDIEDRRRADETVRQRENQLAEAQHIANVGSWDWDLSRGRGTWSDECYRIFGIEPGASDFCEQVMAMILPDDRPHLVSTFDRAVEGKAAYEIEYRILRRDGGERILRSLADIGRDERGVAVKVLGTTQDVTKLRRAEYELKATTEQLRALSARVQSAREEEGIRIAREIHDEVGGTLTTLRWDLEAVKKTVSEPGRSWPADELRDKLTAMLELTDTMINIVRRIASDLRPVVLDVLGLEEAIEWQSRQFQERTGIAVHCESAITNVELNPKQSTAVFRIFQEALTNVLRHAHASRVDVTVVEDTGEFVLMISDNGRGITERERAGELSIGLLGMHERAHLIGGEIDVSGVDGEGTTVTLRVPL